MAKGSEAKGCLNCYAARLNARGLPNLVSPTTGKPFARILDSGPRWTGAVELIESQLLLPLKWKKGRRIFVNSMSDLFHEVLPDAAIDRVFAVMELCPQHQFQVLTKRPERMQWYLTFPDVRKRIAMEATVVMRTTKWLGMDDATGNFLWSGMDNGAIGEYANYLSGLPDRYWPLPNVILGVSVEDQETANARIPPLLQTPAAKRFVSYEPALGPVDFAAYSRVDQIIIGGESGPGARPFDIAWARNTIRQCREAGVVCFVKQLGANAWDPGEPWGGRPTLHPMRIVDRAGADPSEWPEDLRVQENIT